MIVEVNDLRERYASLSDDELADLSRSEGLTDIAKRCLKSEIDKRGLENLEARIAELDDVDKQLQEHRDKKINEGKVSVQKFSKPYYISGAVFFIIGLGLYVLGATKEEDLGLVAMALGGFLILFAMVKSAARLAVLKLLFRK